MFSMTRIHGLDRYCTSSDFISGVCSRRHNSTERRLSTQLHVPVIGFAAVSGTGKTTLLLKLIPLLKAKGLRIGLIKRAHHSFDIDIPGKDSYELRKAGASQVLVGSEHRWALMVENEAPAELELTNLANRMRSNALDLILVEGFKFSAVPKIEIHRPSMGHPLMATSDPNIFAVVTDKPDSIRTGVPVINMNRPGDLAEFICNRLPTSMTCKRNLESSSLLPSHSPRNGSN